MQGAAFMLIGSTLAAVVAFTVARKSGSGENFLAESEGDGSDAQWKQVRTINECVKISPALEFPCAQNATQLSLSGEIQHSVLGALCWW